LDSGDVFWLALALVLVIEGLFPLLSPTQWKRMFSQILQMREGQIRFFGLCSVLGGLLIIWLLT